MPPSTARYWSWLFAAPECREPLLGTYALSAEWRALMDPATEPNAAGLKLAWWREELDRLIRGRPVHPITRYLGELPRATAADFSPLIETLEATARQIAGAPLEHARELEPHGAALFGNPLIVAGRLAAEPAGDDETALRRAVGALGAAQYAAGAIADYRREALRGRVIFPVDELLEARIEIADLTAAAPPMPLKSYLQGLLRRAVGWFETAGASLPAPAANRHVLVLAALGAKHAGGRGEGDGGFRPADLYLAWSTARRASRLTPARRRA